MTPTRLYMAVYEGGRSIRLSPRTEDMDQGFWSPDRGYRLDIDVTGAGESGPSLVIIQTNKGSALSRTNRENSGRQWEVSFSGVRVPQRFRQRVKSLGMGLVDGFLEEDLARILIPVAGLPLDRAVRHSRKRAPASGQGKLQLPAPPVPPVIPAAAGDIREALRLLNEALAREKGMIPEVRGGKGEPYRIAIVWEM